MLARRWKMPSVWKTSARCRSQHPLNLEVLTVAHTAAQLLYGCIDNDQHGWNQSYLPSA